MSPKGSRSSKKSGPLPSLLRKGPWSPGEMTADTMACKSERKPDRINAKDILGCADIRT